MAGMNRSSAATLPPGFRFHPTDEELIIHYLKQKVSASSNPLISTIADVNIYKFNPWELPDKAFFGENEWFFFSPRDRRYPNGTRPNRAAASGYWKAIGTDKPIITSVGSQCLGMKKALVFYKGRPPKGVRTDWMMIEYRLLNDYFPSQRPNGFMRSLLSVVSWMIGFYAESTRKARIRNKSMEEETVMAVLAASPFACGYLQGQEMITTNSTIPQGNKCQRPAEYPMTPLESEELDDQMGQMEFQESSPEHSLSTINSNVRSVRKSIERVLSVGLWTNCSCHHSQRKD